MLGWSATPTFLTGSVFVSDQATLVVLIGCIRRITPEEEVTTVQPTEIMDERRRFPPGSLERIIYEAEAEYGSGGRQNRAQHPQRDNVSLSRPQFNARASTATIVSSVLSARSQVNSRVAKSTDQYSDRLQARQNEDRVRFDAPPRPQRPLPPPKPLPARIAERNRQLKEQNILSQGAVQPRLHFQRPRPRVCQSGDGSRRLGPCSSRDSLRCGVEQISETNCHRHTRHIRRNIANLYAQRKGSRVQEVQK